LHRRRLASRLLHLCEMGFDILLQVQLAEECGDRVIFDVSDLGSLPNLPLV
jgi:hypothetical protein